MKSFLVDCRHAFRLYARTPIASLNAVISFAVAIAAVTAFFSLYVDLVLRPHPGFEQSHRIVTFEWTDGRWSGGLPRELIDRIGEESTTLEAAAGVAGLSFRVGPDRNILPGEMVSSQFFDGIRPRLALGRGFEFSEHRSDGEPVVVISYAYWQQQFGGRTDILGQTIKIDAAGSGYIGGIPEPQGPTDFQIVGVMDKALTGLIQQDTKVMFWLPIERATALVGADINAINAEQSMRGIGRRSAGASASLVADELNARYVNEIGDRVDGLTNVWINALDGLVFDTAVHRSAQRQLQLLLGASLLLALVAAANMSLFILARAPGRRRELAIRMSVGADAKRLARQLLSEVVVLVVISVVLGLIASIWLAAVIPKLSFLRDAQWGEVRLLDWRVIFLVSVVILLLAALVSLVPIFGLTRLGIAGSSRQLSARAGVAQRFAGAAQIAIAGTLASAAIAFAWYLGMLIFGDPGYTIRDRYAIHYVIPVRFDESGLVGLSHGDQVRRREAILSIPGVSDVALVGMVPGLQVAWTASPVVHDDNPSRQTTVRRTHIDSHFVDVLGLDLLHGRSPTENETDVLLVNRALARAIWGRDNVVGESMPRSGDAPASIVGVLSDLSYEHPHAELEPMAFQAGRVSSTQGLAIVATRMKQPDLLQAVRGLVDSGQFEAEILEVASLRSLRDATFVADLARGGLVIVAAILVVVLAAVGFYGTQRYLVMAGRREYAIRSSLGAGPRALGRLVLWRGLQLGMPGLLFSLPLAFVVVARLRGDYLSQDVSSLAIVVVVAIGIATLAIAASLGPALQARKTQPAPLLRED